MQSKHKQGGKNGMKRLKIAGLAVFVITCSYAISSGQAGAAAQKAMAVKEAIAVVHPASNSSCKGLVHFTEVTGGVRVVAELDGLAPNSTHGFHVHEFGDCSAPDATSAGGHYDAAMTMHHGRPEDMVRHTGDMGNIQADAAGKAHLDLLLKGATIDGMQAPILGRAVIVHANPDDFSQPVGNAGARIGCGVIGVMKPSAK
jgi:Cu-Zn family superoxide dismutase